MPTEAVLRAHAVTPAGELAVTAAGDGDKAEWEAFVSTHPDAGYHAWAWRHVIREAFGHQSSYLIAKRGGAVEGVLPMVQINSRLFGRTMTSLPFLNYGGVLADTVEAARALVDRATSIARDGGCRHLEMRHKARQFAHLPCKQHKVTMLLGLRPGMWERLDRKVRNQVRKAEKSGLTVERGGVELLHDFYAVFARNMRDLGTPVYAPKLFDRVLHHFRDRAHLHVVRLKGVPVAAGLTYRTGATVEVPWASSNRDYNSLCPNHLLYWHVIDTAVAEGCEVMDFGRSTPDEGTYKFKEQWGAAPLPLHWEYVLLKGGPLPDQSPKNPKFQVIIELWKRCPLWLANTLGPHIVRSIP